jgi:hypothetical protein
VISTQINLNMQYGIVLRLTICCLVVGGAFALICCAPDQWEGRMYLDYEKVLHVLLTRVYITTEVWLYHMTILTHECSTV